MDDQNRRRWEVKDEVLSDWRELPGEFTAKEIWEMRQKGDFWVALPMLKKEFEADAP
jgi:hypothetical protein